MDLTEEKDTMISRKEEEEEEEQVFHFGMELISGSVLPMVLKAVIELDVLETMAKEEAGVLLSAQDIASRLHYSDTNPEAATMLDRMLRLLASHSLLSCSLSNHTRLYALTPVCRFLTRNSCGVSLAPLSLMNQDPVLMRSWYHLKDAVVEGGIPFNRAYGMSAFEYHGTDQRFNKVFNNGMSHHSTLTMNKILETYKGFHGLTSLVDVGGGTGAILNMIISTYPSIRGVNFDLPHVIQDALPYQGVEHVGGDMFEAVPKGDAIFMKWICHDWSDEHCLKLLKNCYAALPEEGKVIIAECILPEVPDGSRATRCVMNMDLIMLAHNPGGKERTKAEFETLAKGAGFSTVTVACCTFNTWVIEFLKHQV